MSTDENKIIELFQSGQFKLAFTLRKSLNIEIDYSKIDLIGMVDRLSDNYSTLYIPLKNGLTAEIEVGGNPLDGEDRIEWIELHHLNELFLTR